MNVFFKMMHYFSEKTNDIYLYDVALDKKFHKKIDIEIPNECKTVAIDNARIFMIGGLLEGQTIKMTWEYYITNNYLTLKKSMN